MNKILYGLFAFLITASAFPQHFNKQSAPQELTFNFNYTGVFTGYDVQSLGTPQQIWQDPDNPFNVHAVFIYSAQTSGWTDRAGIYLVSSDMGLTWTNMGAVQTGVQARGGFPSISGLTDGRPVVGLHTNDSAAAARAQLYVRNIQGTEWQRFDPGSTLIGDPLYPKVLGLGNNQVFFAALSEGICLNSLNISSGIFTGYNCSNTDASPETYCLEKSENGSIIGLAYIGGLNDSVTFGDVYYRESNDGGITWSEPLLAFQYDYSGDSLGALRGIDLIFLQDTPYIVFETVKQDWSAGSYYVGTPSRIMLWSPEVNNGNAMVLAEAGVNVPHNPVYYYASNDILVPVCRPTIGRSSAGNALFVAFNVVTENVFYWGPPYDSISYTAGYFMYSLDEGHSWTMPVKFTPDSPLREWKYLNISPTNAVSLGDCHLQMSAQADTIPGPYPDPWPFLNLTAQFVGITTTVSLSGINEEQKIPTHFSLSQNYPNPFNPSTTIHYNIPSGTVVTLTLYNVLGQRIKDLVNEYKSPGEYEVKVDMQEYNSGVYFYKLQAGGYVETKKMILIK